MINKNFFKRHCMSAYGIMMLLILSLALFVSCDYRMESHDDSWNLGNKVGIDSLEFQKEHHYWKNDIFYVHTPFQIIRRNNLMIDDVPLADSTIIDKDREIAIVDIVIKRDSLSSKVWNKVISSEGEKGWVAENELLTKIIPNNYVSKFIFYFSELSTLVYILIGIIALTLFLIHRYKKRPLRFPHYNDIETFYPTLLCLIISIDATIYGTIQKFAPQTWIEYYFNPTLNPFSTELPLILIAFIVGLWLLIISFIAVIEDLIHQFNNVADYLAYLSTLILLCTFLYIIFSLSVQIYIGYFILACYIFFSFYRHYHSATPHYTCGKCGAFIAKNGVCHECGSVNELK